MWRLIDEKRRRGGGPSFISELGFHLLVLGWYGMVLVIDPDNSQLIVQLWSPADTFPRFEDNLLTACLHEYKSSVGAALRKSQANGWSYKPRSLEGDVVISNYFYLDESDIYQNMVLIDGKDVTGLVSREDMRLLVAPIGGFPDRGSLEPGTKWMGLVGQSILETNRAAFEDYNKWESFIAQIMRDAAQSKYQEFSTTPKANPEQMRELGALFHYAPGEEGIRPIVPPAIPIELRAALMDKNKRIQKGSFSDAVYGMVERGTAGYALSQLASSSANQILLPYMEAKHYVLAECDRFWLSRLKTSKRAFEVKDKFIEKLSPTDIPEDVVIRVESDIATQRDWLERATVANMLKEHLDDSTILTEILNIPDVGEVKRRRVLDLLTKHPVAQTLNLISAFYAHADYLDLRGDKRLASLYRRAAQAMEAQMGAPPPGAARPTEATAAETARRAGAPEERTRVAPEIMPPEGKGFTPQELREMLGRGRLITR